MDEDEVAAPAEDEGQGGLFARLIRLVTRGGATHSRPDDIDVEYRVDAAPETLTPQQKLQIIAQIPNIAAVLPQEKLGIIGLKVLEEYQIDKSSRSKWEARISDAMDLAMMVAEEKNYPFDNAANVKYPLLTVAALQFNARAYPAIVQGNRVAKCTTWGRDPEGKKAARGARVSEHLSYQLLSDPAWEEDTDKLLVILPIIGSAFRKVWFDPALGKTRSRLVSSGALVVNYFARSMEDVPRATEEMRLYPYEIAERIRAGRFVEFDYKLPSADPQEDPAKGKEDDSPDPADADAPQLFLEQHRLLDLDEDGYQEPYVVTVHHATGKVCRIAANFDADSITIGQDGRVTAIRKQDYFVKYQFLPSPDGGFYGWGFGWLLKDIGETINTTLNLMMDAAHLSTVQGGLISGSAGIKDKSFRLRPGEWRVVQGAAKLTDAMMPIKYDGPSAVLFSLLGTLIEAGKEVAAIKDVLTGDTPSTAPVGTTLALIEQGLQVFTSIYKRIHRALKKELALYARLNRQFLDPAAYNAFFDGQEQFSPQQDYASDDMDIVPVTDPASVSKMQKLGKAQLIRDVATNNPTINQAEATRRVLEAAEIEDVDALLVPPPQPDPEQEMMLKLAAMLEIQEREADIDKKRAETLKTETGAMKDVSDMAGSAEGNYLGRSKLMLDALKAEQAAAQQQDRMELGNGQGRLPGMEGQPGNPAGPGAPEIQLGAGANGIEGPPVQLGGVAPGGLVSPASAGGP